MEGVRLLSDNDNYPSIAVAFEDMKSINVIGAVVMIINKVN
jgi:phage repressor protein C with HTH and peptisase S24 domain